MTPHLPAGGWRALVDALPDGVALSDGTQPGQPVVYVNAAFERLTGYAAADLAGRGLGLLHGEAADQPGLRQLRDAIEAGREARATLQNFRRDGTGFTMDVQLIPIRDADGALTHWLSVHREAAAGAGEGRAAGRFRAVAPEVLQRQDVLTGFRVREAFEELLEHQLAVSQRERQPVALFVVEVDDFDRYTDAFDRAAGDALLRRVAIALAGSFRRRSDLLARLDDSHLAALAHGMDATPAEVHADALIKRVRALALHHPRSATGRFVTLSVGICSGIPGGASSAAAALDAATSALHEARAGGGNRAESVALPGGPDASS